MKTAKIPMSEDELKQLEAQLSVAGPGEGITISFEKDPEKGRITGKNPIKWSVDFEFEPDVLTVSAGGLFAGNVIEGVEEKLDEALMVIRGNK